MNKILVIEDEEAIREVITEILEFEGYEWKSARNGREGIIAAREFNPSLIICDIMMPEMNGYDVLVELKKDSQTDSIPFIFMTAMAESKDMRKGMELGADDYITKPFTNEELLTAIKVRLKKSLQIKSKMEELRSSIAHLLPHELRTPLVSILGYSRLLNEMHKNISPDSIFEYSTAIYEAGMRLNRLVENYILFSKIEIYNKTAIEVKPDPECILTEKVNKTVSKIAKNYSRDEDLEIKITDAVVMCTHAYYLKIIEELVDNAFKFSTRGNRVTVHTFNNSADEHTISVTDKGKGMTAEQIAHVGAYQQFERKKHEQQGSGLGLTISMILAKMCGGKITITSEYGHGTEVTVRMPSGECLIY